MAETLSLSTRRFNWPLHARRARAHATIVACGLWITAGIILWGSPTDRSIFGPLKWTDFVHLYTLGSTARTGNAAELYDATALHRRQVVLVPSSAPDRYLPVYPPQAALLFQPFARWSYGTAALLWTVVTLAIYVGALWAAWRPVRAALPDTRLLIAAAAAFPPFWNLVLHGQTTTVLVAAFVLGWLALERGRPYLAGLALGLIALKPQWGLALAVIVLVHREWALLTGAVTSVALQTVLIVVCLGAATLRDFADMWRRFPEFAPLLEPRPAQMHSLTTVTRLLPG